MSKKNANVFRSVDTISKELDVVDNFVLKNWKKYIVLAVIILIVCAGVMIGMNMYTTSTSNMAFAIENSTTVNSLQSVIKKYNGNVLTDFAKLRLASLLAGDNKYSEALPIYFELGRKSSSEVVRSFAALNDAYVQEALGNRAHAAEIFSRIADSVQSNIQTRNEAQYSAGRIYFSLGNRMEALKYLNQCAHAGSDCFGWPLLAQSLLTTIK